MRTTFLCVTWRASSSSCLKRRSISRAAVGSAHHLGANDFQRHRHAQFCVPRLIDGAHSADAQQADDVIARAERLARRERPARTARRGRGHGPRRTRGVRRRRGRPAPDSTGAAEETTLTPVTPSPNIVGASSADEGVSNAVTEAVTDPLAGCNSTGQTGHRPGAASAPQYGQIIAKSVGRNSVQPRPYFWVWA